MIPVHSAIAQQVRERGITPGTPILKRIIVDTDALSPFSRTVVETTDKKQKIPRVANFNLRYRMRIPVFEKGFYGQIVHYVFFSH